jgi:two-component system, chemotaxis family, sensor kinase CheA
MSPDLQHPDEDLRPLFIEESTESIAEFEAALLRLEQTPDSPATVAQLFRIAHSLKGSSAMMRFTAMAGFTHVLESLLDQFRRGVRPVTPLVVDALLGSVDVLRGLVTQLATDANTTTRLDGNAERVHGRIAAFLEESPRESPAGRHESRDGTPGLFRIEFRPSRDALRRGLDPMRILGQLARLGQVRDVVPDVSALPTLASIDPEQCYLAWTVTLETSCAQAELDDVLGFAADPAATRVTLLPPSSTSAVPEPPLRRASDRDEATVLRVAVDKVDRLVDLVGELVTTQSMLAQAAADATPAGAARLQDAVMRMDRHARELHHRILAVRMVSVKTLFARLPRVVRDLAAARQKQVRIELAGEETELDKAVIEKISDPLLHLVRNAVDHGLEPVEDRRAAGKPDAGCVQLEAFQRSGNVYIDVSDDGRGLDRDRILAKARRQGLVGPDETLSDDDAFALIFRPGFSTAETVTDVSGRGVGMDVVKENVTALGGSITISTEAGRGTRFRIKLPLTVAVLDGQLLSVGEQVYVLPLTAIIESLRPAPASLHTIDGGGEILVARRGSMPFLRLHRIFDVPATSEDPSRGLVVVVEHEERRIALLVDRLLDQQQVVIKSLETHFRKVEGIGGATILGDGRVALILDVAGLVGLVRAGAMRQRSRVVAQA